MKRALLWHVAAPPDFPLHFVPPVSTGLPDPVRPDLQQQVSLHQILAEACVLPVEDELGNILGSWASLRGVYRSENGVWLQCHDVLLYYSKAVMCWLQWSKRCSQKCPLVGWGKHHWIGLFIKHQTLQSLWHASSKPIPFQSEKSEGSPEAPLYSVTFTVLHAETALLLGSSEEHCSLLGHRFISSLGQSESNFP